MKKKKDIAEEPAMKELKEMFQDKDNTRLNKYLEGKGADKMKDKITRAREIIKIGDLTLYSVKALSEKLQVSKDTVKNYLKAGKLQGKKLAGKWYISEQAVKEYFK